MGVVFQGHINHILGLWAAATPTEEEEDEE